MTLPTEAQIDVEFFRSLAHELRTQDNACTSDPIPTVQEEVRDYGIDEEYGGELEWVHDDDDYSPVSEAKARRLQLVYDDRGEERDGYKRLCSRKRWEHVQTFLTVDAAREYIRTQSYRHSGKLRTYIESAYRNPEMRKLREQLLLLGTDSPSDALPTTPAQYLFGGDGDLEFWKLTTSGWFDSSGVHYDSPIAHNPKLTRWRRAVL